MSEDYEHFNQWFVVPLRTLEKLPNGQGGFVALGAACFLYERYAKALLQTEGKKSGTPQLLSQIASDFSVDKATAEAFWDVIRNGVLHQGMPLQKNHGNKTLPSWAFHYSYPPMALEDVNGKPFLKVQPWKFMNRVLELCEDHFDLLQSSGSFPWATIASVPA